MKETTKRDRTLRWLWAMILTGVLLVGIGGLLAPGITLGDCQVKLHPVRHWAFGTEPYIRGSLFGSGCSLTRTHNIGCIAVEITQTHYYSGTPLR
jgi:hypothetical protein